LLIKSSCCFYHHVRNSVATIMSINFWLQKYVLI
jgi:hypothetical protein